MNLNHYQVLARKWRPRTFKDMVGQELTLRTLTNALEQKRIHHAYLFTGTHGVGKTTLARILAKCLNCEIDISPSPCNQCATCQAIDTGQFLDLFEIDAASRTKVEDTRELLENVLYPPTQGRYKIYLIDEVHMLSNHSFNALLKTLEEPPPHIIFLLATTEHKRLPQTILSRCLQFYLKRITPEQIAKHLQYICKSENISYDDSALTKLAIAAEGSMRDALSLLDQSVSFGKGDVNQENTDLMLGNTSQEDLFPLLEAIAAQNAKEAFAIIYKLSEYSYNFKQTLEEFISLLHKIAVHQLIPHLSNESLNSLSKRFTPADIQIYYQIALLGRRDLWLAPSPKQGFEMVILRMLAFQTNDIASIEITEPTEKQELSEMESPTLLSWRELLPTLELSGMSYALASNCTLRKMTEENIELTLSVNHKPMLNPKAQERIAEALTRYFKRPMQLSIQLSTDELATPLKQQLTEDEQRLTSAKKAASENSQIKKFIEMYDATIEVSLLTSALDIPKDH